MSIRDLFSRSSKRAKVTTSEVSKNQVVCDTMRIKELVTNWTRNDGWEFEHFADFLELAGLKTPVKLSEWNEEKKNFKCLTALNNEVLISLRFGSWLDTCSEIRVEDGDEIRSYIPNYNSEKGKSIPEVTLASRVIKRNGKELSSYYCRYFCNRTLKIDDTHTLKIEIYEPGKADEKSEVFVLRNCGDIEEYLLGLDNSLDVAQVYDTMMRFLDFSKEDICSSQKILVSHCECIDKKERVLGKILLANGQMQEYAIRENGETFHVFRGGNWRFSSGQITFSYLEEKKSYDFTITGAEESIINANQNELMSRVKEKISELWKFVE